jgi:hypothetical protein
VHVSTVEGARVIEEHARQGRDVTGEVRFRPLLPLEGPATLERRSVWRLVSVCLSRAIYLSDKPLISQVCSHHLDVPESAITGSSDAEACHLLCAPPLRPQADCDGSVVCGVWRTRTQLCSLCRRSAHPAFQALGGSDCAVAGDRCPPCGAFPCPVSQSQPLSSPTTVPSHALSAPGAGAWSATLKATARGSKDRACPRTTLCPGGCRALSSGSFCCMSSLEISFFLGAVHPVSGNYIPSSRNCFRPPPS